MSTTENPATVFMILWQYVSGLKASARAIATDPCDSLRDRVRAILQGGSLAEVMTALNALLKTPDLESVDSKLAVMVEIDQAFGLIHPRAVIVSPGHGASSKHMIPEWLTELKKQRRTLGFYCEVGTARVIPRGPLTRGAREENASSADSVADRFAYIGVVPCEVKENGRVVPVRIIAIDSNSGSGMHPARLPGSEIVGFIPIAEEVGEVLQINRQSHDKHFVDFQPHPDLDCAVRFMEAIQTNEPVDIAMAPELVMPHRHATALPNLIARSTLPYKNRPRLFVAGSGATKDKEGNQAWNESTILNGIGAVLWTQRKVQQAGIGQYRAEQFGLPDPGKSGMVMEDNASGDEIVIADVSGLGRCVILICQDIMARPLSEEIVKEYQPDWVFVPILDPELFDGGWVHKRAHDLSSESHARYLVATSTGLPRMKGVTGLPCFGLAVGPQAPVGDMPGRQCALVSSESKSTPKLARIQWNTADAYWRVTKLGTITRSV